MTSQPTDRLASVLVVDDTSANLRLLSQMLTENGYQARPVRSGPQALAAAQTLPPDLILLDIRMPGMDGYEVCKLLKADPRTRDIPVLFISALSETEDKIKAFTAGGVDYVTKPFQLEEILARVQTHLTLRSLQRRLEQQIVERDELITDLHAYAHTVAHDLRNPIAVALGYADLLQGAEDLYPPEDRQLFLASLTEILLKMSTITKELLLLAEVRQMELRVAPVSMEQPVHEALERLAGEAKEAGAQIQAPEAWPSALGYVPWLEQVWVNYISNAIKYGGSPAQIELGATEPIDGYVRFWVRDHGPGLTPEQQARLYSAFTRIDQGQAIGHGLGLSIVQRIVTKLNGQVGVESAGLGQGCTFWFTLPAGPPEAPLEQVLLELAPA